MTDTTTHKVICNKCKVPLAPIADSNPERWTCPVCNVSDTRENVLREAGEHAKEVAARHLQDKARSIAQNSKFIKFEGKTIPKQHYRFITDFKL